MADPAPTGGRGARDRILAAARQLFYRQGLNVTGIAELCEVAHVSRRTLYQHFAGKDELVLAYLAAFPDDLAHPPTAVLRRDDLSPRARLLELFSALTQSVRPFRGDPYLTAAVEAADPADPVHRFAAQQGRRLTAQLIDLARGAGARDPEGVGRRLALLYAGAAAEMVLLDSPEPAEVAWGMAAAILRDAIPPAAI